MDSSLRLPSLLLLLALALGVAGSGCFPFIVIDDDDDAADDDDASSLFPDPNRWYRLKTAEFGPWQCLESGDGTFGSFMTGCANYSGQFWSLRLAAGERERYQLRSEFQGGDKCLDGNDPNAGVYDGAAYMASCSGASSQRWELVRDGDAYRLKTPYHGENECLDAIQPAGSANVGNARMAACDSTNRQRWEIVDGDEPLDFGLTGHSVVISGATHANGNRTLSVTCPPGQVVLGGGGSWDTSRITLDYSGPESATTWSIGGWSDTGGDWTVSAVCVDAGSAPGHEVVINEGTHPSGGQWIEATCPDGKVVTGGGGFRDPWNISLDNSLPLDEQTWGIAGLGTDSGSYWFAQAVCVQENAVQGYTTVSESGTHPNGGANIQATCPAGSKVLGGGGYWDADRIFQDSNQPVSDSAWGLSGFSSNGGAWWATAVCAEAE